MRFPMRTVPGPLFAGALVLLAAPVAAQTPVAAEQRVADNRIPVVALDARGVYSPLGQDATTAASLSTSATNLKSKTFGLMGGLHIYPIRSRNFALGVGGDAILVPGNSQPKEAVTKKPVGPEIKRRLRGISGQVSLNFGKRQGWSYLTGGMGPTSFESYLGVEQGSGQTEKLPDGLRPMTLNVGGGARWFNFAHLAFGLDFRMYLTKAAVATSVTAARAAKKVIILSAGFSLK